MAHLQKGDSILLAKGDVWQISADYIPKGRLGKLLARLYVPQDYVVVQVADVNILNGEPTARLEVLAAISG